MNKKSELLRAFLLTGVLVMSALKTVPAMADGGTTSPSDPSAATPAARTAPRAAASQLPPGTKVVVLDSSGHKVPLGSQAAQDLLQGGDPIWCPSSVGLPMPGVAGCSPAIYDGDLATLITNIENGNFTPPSVNSTIWILGGANSTSDVWLQGSGAFSPWANFTLTLKGGWNGPGTGTVSTLNPSTFNSYIWISNWNNTVTVSDLSINGSSSTGLSISNHKNIVLARVASTGNASDGADLDTTLGTGMISISGSTFDSNQGRYGLYAGGNSAMTLTNVSASWNSNFLGSANGAYLDNHCATGCTATVTLAGSNDFSGNSHTGLDIFSDGAIQLNQVAANSNGAGYGAYLENDYTGATGGITISGNNTFGSNHLNGLNVLSHGAIKLTAVTADSNAGRGAYLDNSGAGSAMPVAISSFSEFNSNGASGLQINSKGLIAVTGVTASANITGNGALLDNSSAATAAGVTLSGTNIFDGNATYGLHVVSNGAITSGSLLANSNQGGFGAQLDNSGAAGTLPITLIGTSSFSGNSMDGLDMNSEGVISANNVIADANGEGGAQIKNDYSSSTPSKVKITGANLLDHNGGTGLSVLSAGMISINNLDASDNDIGAKIDNSAASTPQVVTLTGTNTFNSNSFFGASFQATGAVTVSNLTAVNSQTSEGVAIKNDYLGVSKPQAVTMLGTNNVSLSWQSNLTVKTYGAITINNLTANSSNQLFGALLDNSGGTTPANVTLNGTNTFDGNHEYGLAIHSSGAITASNLNAVGNGAANASSPGAFGYGASLDNSLAASPKSVTLNGTNTFDDNHNGGYGLLITSKGAITTNNLTASNNSDFSGAQLNNDFAGASGGIQLKGSNAFVHNSSDGLEISSTGTVTMTHVTADQDYFSGLVVSTPGTVTVSCGSFIANGQSHSAGYGVDISATHTTLIGVDAYQNWSGDYSITGGSTSVRVCSVP